MEDTMNIDIFPIPMMFDTIYTVRSEGVILIDGGDPNKIGNLKRGLERASIKPEEIKLILLTHGHWDHIGSAKDIQILSAAKILLHQKDMHFLNEIHPSQPPGFTLWGKVIIEGLTRYTSNMHIPTFEVDIVAGDDEISLTDYGIPGKVVYTPGHSWGSVSVLLDAGQVFVGDLAMNMFPMRLSPGLPIFGDNIQTIKESWQKLLDMGAKTVYPAHGKPFPAEIMKKAVS
jgi:glyoxylase-like metal-dependent hydrolase (beta-lactamase superfamily II)